MMSHEHIERLGIELHPVGAMGLGGAELGAVRAHQGPGEGNRGPLFVDVTPTLCEELAATGAGRDGEPEEAEERRILPPRPLQ